MTLSGEGKSECRKEGQQVITHEGYERKKLIEGNERKTVLCL